MSYTKEQLIAFEDNVAELFNDGQIRSPVHMSGGDEEELIEIFKKIKPNDWVFSNYRSHYHALLKGIEPDWLLNWIKGNKSIHVMNSEHRFLTSAIVGGMLSIALGTALSIKLKKEREIKSLPGTPSMGNEIDWSKISWESLPHVWCFIGDMTATTGQFWECWNYAKNFDLPITFIIADNGLSTDTDTKTAWGMDKVFTHWYESPNMINKNIIYYKYTRRFPHYGTGRFIQKLWDEIDADKEDVRAKGF